ncbi:peptidase MA family metallohydrolase [Anaerolineales bacterium HSG25]|nr:peptidase MA family metallohydrolase [Anaerolineales bacterium HSG25]
MAYRRLILFITIIFLLYIPKATLAQTPINDNSSAQFNIDWQELNTEYFTIVYATKIEVREREDDELKPIDCPDCGQAEAEKYATFVDGLYDNLATIFATDIETPVNIRLYPTEESYFEINPIAEYLTGVIAHALNNRKEIAVALPRTQGITEPQLVNNMRHEISHLFASKLADGKLTAGFQEGIAQYLEKPTDKTANNPALLKQAFEQGRLLSWDELDQSREIYRDPQVAYPQSLSIVSFLIDRYGLPKILEFIEMTGRESGYRAALNATYNKSAEVLEAEWKAYLPSYFDSRWQINAIYNYDLGRVTQLVERGAYSDATTEINEIVTLLESTNQHETLTRAQDLLYRAEQGQTAAGLAEESRSALMASDYQQTINKGIAAQQMYNALGYQDRLPEIQTYIYRAEIGQEALQQLEYGNRLLNQLRFMEAERQINEATIRLQALNNPNAAQQGLNLLEESARRQRLLAYTLLVIGALLFLANMVHRLYHRMVAHPLEVEFR